MPVVSAQASNGPLASSGGDVSAQGRQVLRQVFDQHGPVSPQHAERICLERQVALARVAVTVVGHDTLGRPQIGYGRIPITNTPGRPFILDAGMQRYYALGLNDTKTGILLKNIVKSLGSIGCRSQEPGWPQ